MSLLPRPRPTASPPPAPTSRLTPSLRSRPRRLAVGLGALALVVGVAPFLPDSDGPDRSIEPRRTVLATSSTAGAGEVTPAMQAEIDRVVREGFAAPRVSARSTARSLADSAVRCADFEGQRYCLGVGWTTRTEDEVVDDLASTAARQAAGRETTGDLDQLAVLERSARMAPQARAASERAELTDAAMSVAKVWLLRHEIQGVPLPAGFTERHPEAVMSAGSTRTTAATTTTTAASTTSSTTSARKGMADYPRRSWILRPRHSRSQSRTYWCGPASMQAIAWGWRGEPSPQRAWARRLGTTSSGTAITEMVRVTNRYTGWDRDDRAGRYVVLDIGDWSFRQWYLLMMRHIEDYRAPVVLHPVLLKRYYPYLDDDASGHFQVGRGYDKNPDGRKLLGYIEVWDQSRFDPSEPRIARRQWRSAYKSYRANRAHFQHNVGV